MGESSVEGGGPHSESPNAVRLVEEGSTHDRLLANGHVHARPETMHATADAHAPPPTSHAPAHAPAFAHAEHVGWGPDAAVFPHERLDAYQVALRMAALAKKVAASIPRGHRNVADHMQRSAQNTVLLLAEGANRRTAGEKRQRFGESRGECGEVAASADLVIVMELGSRGDAQELKALAARVSAMLTGLLKRLG